MPKPTKGPRLGGGPAHERLLLANLASALFTHKSIKTTEAKAKRLRPVAERLITFAKRGDLHSRRRVLGVIGDKTVVHELFTQIAPLVENRDGGYTRITKLGFRKGDNASMVQIELVLEPVNARPRPKADRVPDAAPVEEPADFADGTVTDDGADDTAASADSAEPLDDGSAPSAEFVVKGNKDSMKYHTADSQYFDQTIAEVWFTTPEAAEKAGFTAPGADTVADDK